MNIKVLSAKLQLFSSGLNVLEIVAQGHLLLTWVDFFPNMDK